MIRQDFTGWNRAHKGAYLKGAKAQQAGDPISSCPYNDYRKPSGKLSWSRSFITAWQDGWRDAAAEASKQQPTEGG